MSISKENIEERKNVLMNDMNAAKQRKKQEDIALLNALTGAYQQCEQFLKESDNEELDNEELDNEEPEMASDDGNDEE